MILLTTEAKPSQATQTKSQAKPPDPEIVESSVPRVPANLAMWSHRRMARFAADSLKQDREVVLTAVRRNALALETLSRKDSVPLCILTLNHALTEQVCFRRAAIGPADCLCRSVSLTAGQHVESLCRVAVRCMHFDCLGKCKEKLWSSHPQT